MTAYTETKKRKMVNSSAETRNVPLIMTVKDLYALMKKGHLFSDRRRLQRLLKPWTKEKVASYLTTLFNCWNFKDSFQLAPIDAIIENTKSKIHPSEADYEDLLEVLTHLEQLKADGYVYLILDGQHRLDTIFKFMNDSKDAIDLRPTTPIRLKYENEEGHVSLKGKFSKMSEGMKEYIENTEVSVILWKNASIIDLPEVFKTSNSMMPMTKHECRILNWNPLCKWIVDLVEDNINIKTMFSYWKQMTGEYSLDSKGETLLVAEMLQYVADNYYEGYDSKKLDGMLHPNPKGVTITEEHKRTCKKILETIANGIAEFVALDPKKNDKIVKKFSKTSFYNLFIHTSIVLQETNVWRCETKLSGKYKIKDPLSWVKMFLDKEFARIYNKESYVLLPSPKGKRGKVTKQWHDQSYYAHNKDQKHSGKVCTAGVGGSKYDCQDWARIRYIAKDLAEDFEEFLRLGIVQEVGSRDTGFTREDALVHHGVFITRSKDIEIHESRPVSKGGHRLPGNTDAIERTQNRNTKDNITVPHV